MLIILSQFAGKLPYTFVLPKNWTINAQTHSIAGVAHLHFIIRGVAYIGSYIYPNPLVTAVPAAPTDLAIIN